MRFKIDAYPASNITVLFDRITVAKVSRDKLRAILGEVAMMDTPEIIVAIAQNGIVAQIDERRLVVSDQTGAVPGKQDLASTLLGVRNTLSESTPQVYGFNYDLAITLEGAIDAAQWITSVFVPTAPTFQTAWNVEQLVAMPRLVYRRRSVRYDLRFEPIKDSTLIVHLNAQFDTSTLPGAQVLLEEFESEVKEVSRILEKL